MQLWLKQVRCMWHLGLIVSQTGHFPQATVTCSCPEWKQEIAFLLFINCESEITRILYASPDPHLWGFKYLITPSRLLLRSYKGILTVPAHNAAWCNCTAIFYEMRLEKLPFGSELLHKSSWSGAFWTRQLLCLHGPHGLLNDRQKILKEPQTCLQDIFSPGLIHTLYRHVHQKHSTKAKHAGSGEVCLTRQGFSLKKSTFCAV